VSGRDNGIDGGIGSSGSGFELAVTTLPSDSLENHVDHKKTTSKDSESSGGGEGG